MIRIINGEDTVFDRLMKGTLKCPRTSPLTSKMTGRGGGGQL